MDGSLVTRLMNGRRKDGCVDGNVCGLRKG